MAPPRSAGTAALAALLLLAGGGCFRAYNPTYFPHWGDGGALTRTHGKPSGNAYFSNFDPHACRVTLTPRHASSPCGKEIVFVASVLDEDDFPRRSRRVEWLIDGPGHIVEVDESGWFAGRGYKVDNKYAVSHTDYHEHRLTRGNDDPRDDVVICPGQTWCVVASAVEGLTTVTAYAPEVHNWDRGRATATVSWGGAGGVPHPAPAIPGAEPFAPAPGAGGVVFPPPVISHSPGDVDLTTTVARGRANNPNVRVRYRVLDARTGQLVGRSGADGGRAGTALYGDNPRLSEVEPDARGRASVTLRAAGDGERTRVAIEVVKLGADGFETGEVIDSSETVVEWSAPDLVLTARAPRGAPPGGEAPVTVSLKNAGRAESRAVTLRLTLPAGAEVARTEPEGRPQGRSVAWQFPPLAAGRSAEATATVRATGAGPLELVASAETADGMRAEKAVTLPVESASFDFALTAPPAAATGAPVKVGVAVTNTGGAPLGGVTAWLALPDGVESDGGSPLELPVGAVPPGATKKAEATLRLTKPGRVRLVATATADGGLSRKAEATVEAKRSEVKLSLIGPEKVKLGQSGLWEVKLANAGDAPLTGGTLRVQLPRGLSVTTAHDSGRAVAADVAEWPVSDVRPGASQVVRVSALCDEIVTGAKLRATYRSPELPEPASSTAAVDVEGEPALSVEILDPPGTMGAGRKANVRVRVRNTGRGPARGVELTLSTTAEMEVVGGVGPDRRRIGPAGSGRVQFDRLSELQPGESAAFVAELVAAKPGLARLTAEVRAGHLPQPTRDEQTTQVVP